MLNGKRMRSMNIESVWMRLFGERPTWSASLAILLPAVLWFLLGFAAAILASLFWSALCSRTERSPRPNVSETGVTI